MWLAYVCSKHNKVKGHCWNKQQHFRHLEAFFLDDVYQFLLFTGVGGPEAGAS